MRHLLKRHPFAVEAFFDFTLALTFAVPAHRLEPLLYPGLELDTFESETEGDTGFLAVALVQTRALRPDFMPAVLGQDFFLTGYRIFVRHRTPEGRSLRGLQVLRSDADNLWMRAPRARAAYPPNPEAVRRCGCRAAEERTCGTVCGNASLQSAALGTTLDNRGGGPMPRPRTTATVCWMALLLVAGATGAEEPISAQGEVELSDPKGDLGPMSTSGGEEPPLDVVALKVRSDGETLTLEAELAGEPGDFASGVVRLLIDTDNDPSTGISAFMDRPGGFEYGAELMLCMEYDGRASACAGGMGDLPVSDRWGAIELERFEGDSLHGPKETLIRAMQFPGKRSSEKVPFADRVVASSIAYADLEVASGQTIRLLAQEAGGQPHEGDGYFPIVLLTLK